MCNYKTNAPLSETLISLLKGQFFHIVITGEVQKGKSTLLQNILTYVDKNRLKGFYSERCNGKSNIVDGVYLHSVHTPFDKRTYTENNRVATETSEAHDFNSMIKHTNIFETLGVSLLKDINDNDIVIMDEIGTLEKDARVFCGTINNIFSSKFPLIAVIKKKDSSFLNSLLNHKNNSAVIEVKDNFEYSITLCK